jgi:subtilisin family serine protease
VDARGAWATTLGSSGVTVAVLDDGVDVDHPNLSSRIRRRPDPGERRDRYGRDFFVGENAPDHFDPRPKRFVAPYHMMEGNDIHGTPCAGVIAASGASGGILGIAPNCRVLPVKIFHADALAAESQVADAIRYATTFAHVLSCSWSGPRSPDIEAALAEAAAGREGRGVPVFVATGNGHPAAAFVGYPAASPHAIGIGASTDQNEIAFYSQRGPEVSVVAPSSGGTRGITTTDVGYPNRGFNLGNAAQGGVNGLHTNSFGGTSSATPLAAGIAALMLSVDAELSREEVKQILQQTADKIGPAGTYDANGFSQIYGFGCVNAAAAVAAAQAARANRGGGRVAAVGRRRRRRAA